MTRMLVKLRRTRKRMSGKRLMEVEMMDHRWSF